MPYDPDIHHRRSIRLPLCDYAAGAYFVTICAQDREMLFGVVDHGIVRLSPAGRMLEEVWTELPAHYPGVGVDAFVVMPNHVHGIVMLRGPSAGEGASQGDPAVPTVRGIRPQASSALTLFDVVHRFKSYTTTLYRHGVVDSGWPPFPGRLWQRNYYEHVIRDDADLERVGEYIDDNPANWDTDEENVSPWRPPGPGS